MTNENQIKLDPISPAELAALYKIDPKTLKKWLDRHSHIIGERVGRFYNTSQVRKIFNCIGTPSGVYVE